MFDPESGFQNRNPNYNPGAPLPPAKPLPLTATPPPQPYGADATPQPTVAHVPYPGWKPGMPRNPRNLPPPGSPAPGGGAPGVPGATPGVPPPPPAPTPFQPFQPPGGGGAGGPGGPGSQPSPWDMPAMPPGGNVPQAGNFNDPFNQFLSAVPLMNLNMNKQISDAMAQAGFGGTRYGTAAMGKAGEIGAENSLAQNQMFTQMLSDFANKSQDRALQASGLGLGAGNLLDQMQQNRIGTLAGLGQTEQQRQDQFANTRFQDWSTNRLGWLPLLIQAFSGQHAGSPGQIFTTQTPGTPSTIQQWGPLLGALLGGG